MYRLKTFCLAFSVQAGLVLISAVYFVLSITIMITNWVDFDFDNFATGAVIFWVVLLVVTAAMLVLVAYSEKWLAALVSLLLMSVVILFWLFVSLLPLLEQVDENYIEGRDYEIEGDMFRFLGFDGRSIGATDVRRLMQKNYCINLRCGETLWLVDMGWRTKFTEWPESVLKKVAEERKRSKSFPMSSPMMKSMQQRKAPRKKTYAEFNLKHYKRDDWDDKEENWIAVMPVLSELKRGGAGTVFKSKGSGYEVPCMFVPTPRRLKKELPIRTTTSRPTTTFKIPHMIFPLKNRNVNYFSQPVAAGCFVIFAVVLIYFWMIVLSAFIVLS